MESTVELFNAIPNWLGAGVIAVTAAAVGFFGRRWFDSWDANRARNNAAIQELERLQALLEESRSVFVSQNRQVRQLMTILRERLGDQFPSVAGYDETFFQAYDRMTDEEKELFLVIRGTTSHSVHRLNKRLRDWVDTYSAGRLTGTSSDAIDAFDVELQQLRLHLNGWFAKYEAIFQQSERRSLVYLADEKQHGIGFPRQLDTKLAAVLDELQAS